MAKKKSKKKEIKKAVVKNNSKSRLNSYLAIAIALLAFIIYSNTLGHEFALDDFSVIKDNYVTQQGVEGLSTIWTTHYRFGYKSFEPELYRPLPLTMFAIEWEISPDNPFIHHLINVALYILTGLVLFFTLNKIMPDKKLIAFLGTVFFIAHPVHTEVVANIKSRDEILAFLFFIGAINWLWNYIKKGKTAWLLGAVACYTLSLFSKESAITFLAAIPLFLYFFSTTNWKKIGMISSFFLIPSLAFLAIRAAVLGGMGNVKTVSVLDNLLVDIDSPVSLMATKVLLIGKYFWTMIFPHPLSHEFGFNQIPATGFSDWRVLLTLVFLIGLIVFTILKIKQKHFLVFCILFFGITFSLASNVLVLIGTSYGERILYAPLLAFTLAMAYALNFYFGKQHKGKSFIKNYQVSLLVGLVISGLYATKTLLRNPAWKNSTTLFATDVKIANNSAKLNYHHGLELSKAGNEERDPAKKNQLFQEAKAAFQKAIDIYPNYGDAYGQQGLTLYREGNRQAAMENYQKALQYNPNSALVYSNMGIIFFETQDYDQAISVYEKAVEFDPSFVDAYRNLGSVYANKKDFQKAIQYFSKAYQYAPDDATVNYYLGMAYRDAGNAAKSQEFFNRAYQLDPSLKR